MEGLKRKLQAQECKVREVDPEDEYHSIDAKAKKPQNASEQDHPQEPMGPSQLRRSVAAGSGETQHDKYAGRLVTVKDWMKTDTGSELDQPINKAQSVDEEELGGQDNADVDDDEEDKVDDQVEAGSDNDQVEAGSDNDQVEAGSDNDQVEENNSYSSTSTSNSVGEKSKQKHEQPSDLIKQLQVSAKADIEKAKAVKSQLTMYDRILAVRIGIQKSLVATNKLAEMKHEGGKVPEDQEDSAKKQARIAIEDLMEVGSKISTLRATFMEPIDGEPPRKRQKGNHGDKEEYLRDCLEETDQLDKRLSTYLQTTVRKWSTKINSTTALNTKKFDSASKQSNIMDKLDRIWTSKDERDKLILRSQTSRQRPNPSVNPHETNHSSAPRIFEDRDFYLSLLKDVVESATRKQDLAEDSMISNNDYRANRVHRPKVDPKSTKGRKMRYNTHDKLVSVMVPIQNELWTDDQKDELFASLFGFGFDKTHDNHAQEFTLSKSDGFKLF